MKRAWYTPSSGAAFFMIGMTGGLPHAYQMGGELYAAHISSTHGPAPSARELQATSCPELLGTLTWARKSLRRTPAEAEAEGDPVHWAGTTARRKRKGLRRYRKPSHYCSYTIAVPPAGHQALPGTDAVQWFPSPSAQLAIPLPGGFPCQTVVRRFEHQC